MKKTLIASLLLALTVTNLGVKHTVKAYNEPAFNFKPGGWELVQAPGMGIRMEQHTADAFKRAMQDFFPTYFVADMNLPQQYQYQLNFLLDAITWNIEWYDIAYDAPTFDIQDIKFIMTDAYDKPQIIVDFPALEHFHMHAKQKIDAWWIPDDSDVSLDFDNFDVDFSASLHINQEGNLRPVFYTFHLQFGESYFYHENWFLTFVMHQFIEFAIVMVENTAYICGELIFSQIGEPVLTSFFNNYKMILKDMPSPFLGQEGTYADFQFDWRSTQDPVIKEGQLDMRIVGEVMYGYSACALAPDNFDFMQAEVYSQVVMTESAASCFFNSVAASPIGKFNLNQNKTNMLFNVTDIVTDSSAMANHIPIFLEKLGPNKPLKALVEFGDISVTLGQFDCDIIMDYILRFSIMSDDVKSTELIYDEIHFITSANIKTENDIAHIDVLTNRINIENKFGGKQLPIRNGMNISKNEYREFISTLGFSAKYWKDWINQSVFKDGVRFPYRPEEFLTDLKFQEKSAHLFFELEPEIANLLEKDFWVN